MQRLGGCSWRGSLFTSLTLILLLFGCGGGGGEAPPDTGGISIDFPTTDSAFTTHEASITLSGTAFISPDRSVCCGDSFTNDSGVDVTWSNSTGGSGGAAQSVGTCTPFGVRPFLCNHTWRATVPLAVGTNVIRVFATDGKRSGSDSITVTRPPDTTPPTISSTTPGRSAINVPVNRGVSITFSEAMDNATITSASFTLRDDGGNLVAGTISIADRTATLQPNSFLAGFSDYTATVSDTVKDFAGNSLSAPFTWTFKTGSADLTSPSIVSVSPASGSACSALDTDIVVNFDEEISGSTLSFSSFNVQPSTNASIYLQGDGKSAVFDPAGFLAASNTYSATVSPGIKDLAGNSAPLFTWSFSTAAGVGTWQSVLQLFIPVTGSYVWTGTEMIVFGGAVSQSQAGARLNPTTESWTYLPPGPFARTGHVAVWTGSEMIIWGGQTTISGPFNDGSRYRPSTDTWHPMSNIGAPSARVNATAVWTGSEMIVWGGEGEGLLAATDHAAYNPVTDTWRAISALGAAPTPNKRARHSAIWTGSLMIVWGGHAGCFTADCPPTTGAMYNPVTDTWEPLNTAGEPSNRSEHTAVWTGTEMIIWGGHNFVGNTYGIGLNTGALYNPSTNTWRSVSTACSASGRAGHGALWTGTEMVIMGGWTISGSRRTGALYDPATDTWRHMPLNSLEGFAAWTGTQMFVWNSGTGTGGLYTP